AADGSETAIPGAVNHFYKITSADVGYKIKFVANGSGVYVGDYVQTTGVAKASAEDADVVWAIDVALTGAETVGETLTATVAPASANAAFQWYRVDVETNVETAIADATGPSYAIQAADASARLKVVATFGDLRATATSDIVKAAANNAIDDVFEDYLESGLDDDFLTF
ncbi:MAG: hypothetical protein HUK22_02310, partial [Thermoguttaceae bacterium]|nr:hypothetical protein [Thermoguttaceae bacterium]